jgi:AT hook motif
MNDGSSVIPPTNTGTCTCTDMLCDRCHQVVDDHDNIPIQSRACEHSCCSRCLESMAQDADTCTATVVDCYQCQAPNAFDTSTAEFYRHRNLMACSIYKVMIQREEYWRQQAKQWQAQAPKLQKQEQQQQQDTNTPNASTTTTTTTNQKIAPARQDDTSTSNNNNNNNNSNNTVAAVAQTQEQYHIPGVAFLSSIGQFMDGDSHVEQEETELEKKAHQQKEKDNTIATLAAAAATKAVVSTSLSDPPLVWVDYLSLRRRAYLLAVEGTKARIRWEIAATKDEEEDDLLVDLAMVHRFSYPEECLRKRPLSIPTGTMSHHGRSVQRKSYLQPPSASSSSRKNSRRAQSSFLAWPSSTREQKIPLDSADSPPFSVTNPTSFFTHGWNTWDHDDTDDDDDDDSMHESKSPRRRGRPPKTKRPRGRPPKNSIRSLSQETRPAKRPRGRPPKNNNTSAGKIPRGSPKEKRPRGRPRKHHPIPGNLGEGFMATTTATTAETEQPPKRPRGRPPNNRLDSPGPRPRGRPRKHPVQATLHDEEPVVKRGPGRPKKSPADMTIDHSYAEQPSPALVKNVRDQDEAAFPQGIGTYEAKATEEPGSASPGKRGRGRPRKNPVQGILKQEEPDASVTRGPDLLTKESPEEQSAAAAVKRGPGRPRKSSASPSSVKRGPGRPRKSLGCNSIVGRTEEEFKEQSHQQQQFESPTGNHSATDASVKRGRGRPKKVPLVSTIVLTPEEQSAAPAKRGRGRPRKVHVDIIAEQESERSPAAGATRFHASDSRAERVTQVLGEAHSAPVPAVDAPDDGFVL